MRGVGCRAALSRRRAITAWLFVAALLVVTGCARPRDDNLKAFATATSALVTAAKTAGDLNVEIDAKIKLTKAATKFASRSDPHFVFPAPAGEFVGGHSDADWKAIRAFLSAVSAYADALQKANDPKLETGLSDKTTGLFTALANARSAMDTARSMKPSSSCKSACVAKRKQEVLTIGGIVANVVTIASNIYAAYEIQKSMEAMQPHLEAARQPLTNAINAVIADDQTKFDDYLVAAQQKLRAIAGSEDKLRDLSEKQREAIALRARETNVAFNDVKFIAKYDAYVSLNDDYRTLEARVAALSSLSSAVGAMITAHGKLMEDLDSKTALLDFVKSVADIADKLEKIKELHKQK